MAAAGDALARGLHPDQLHAVVAGEGRERADRVRAAADAGHHARRQPPAPLQDLRARLVADHALEVADERRERRRADAGADRVVRVPHVGHPVADGGRDGLLERARARVDAAHRRAQEAHALHVGLLAAHVLRAHVDDALQPEQRAGRGGGHAVLPGARLGDDPRLAHAVGEQALADRVVELVRAGVHEVLALQPHGPADGLGQALRVVERGGPPAVVAPQAVELGLVARVGARGHPRRLELGEGGHQRLGDVLAAVGAEAMLDRGHDGTAEGASVAGAGASAAAGGGQRGFRGRRGRLPRPRGRRPAAPGP